MQDKIILPDNRVFGRIEKTDDRDLGFPVRAILREDINIRQKNWWSDGWWGDQGRTSHCVCYSWLHWLEDGPVIQDSIPGRSKPLIAPHLFYAAAQLRDRWPGENYNGTSVRAGAKILKELGVISEYRWAKNIDDLVDTLLTVGPVVVGTKWFSDMNLPERDWRIKPTGRPMGGHAYLLNGVDVDAELIRVKNSWGKKWGKDGFAYISFDDFSKLLSSGGEACTATENKVTELPDIRKLKAVSGGRGIT